MTINRNNYESFFLLYVDNELSAADRISVEEFVKSNTDLKKELALLIETTLPDEKMVFPLKGLMLKEAFPASLQEDMLLHLDHALAASPAAVLEGLIAENSAVGEEWEILQQTKLDPSETIAFSDKHLLYRKERDKVVVMRYWKLAIAALFIGAGLYFGAIFFINKKPVNGTEVSVVNSGKQDTLNIKSTGLQHDSQTAYSTNTIKAITDSDPKQAIVMDPDNNNNATNVATRNTRVIPKSKTTSIQNPPAPQDQVTKSESPKKETNNLPVPYFENINKDKRNPQAIVNVEHEKKENTAKDPSGNIAVVANQVKPSINIPATNNGLLPDQNDNQSKLAVYNELEQKNDDHILYMNEEKVSHSKLGGFFRKIKRVIARNTKIKTGDGLRIGGFEIASK